MQITCRIGAFRSAAREHRDASDHLAGAPREERGIRIVGRKRGDVDEPCSRLYRHERHGEVRVVHDKNDRSRAEFGALCGKVLDRERLVGFHRLCGKSEARERLGELCGSLCEVRTALTVDHRDEPLRRDLHGPTSTAHHLRAPLGTFGFRKGLFLSRACCESDEAQHSNRLLHVHSSSIPR